MPRKLKIEDLDGKVLLTSGAAKLLGKTRSGVIWLSMVGRLPSIKIGTARLFLRSDVEALARAPKAK